MADEAKETAVEEQTPTTPPQEEKPKETTPPADGGTTETPKEEKAIEIDLADFKKNEKTGKFEYVDPENPEGTKYQGDSIPDVIRQMAKGIKEKDSYIATLKSKQVSVPTVEEIEQDVETSVEPEFVDESEVLLAVAKKRGLDPAMLRLSEEKWREMEAQQGVRAVNRLDNLIQAVQQETRNIVAAENLKVMNKTVRNEQLSTIGEMMREEGVDLGRDSIKTFIKEELENPKNYKNGLLKSGVLVARAHKEISKAQKESLKSTTKKQVETEIAAGREKKKEVASDGSSTGSTAKVQRKPPENMDQVHARAMEYFQK